VKRLEAMEEFEELGSGYRLAMRDLEIRGAGNVLGVEQHGHVAAVGFELYCRMLKETVEALRGETRDLTPPCRVEAPYSCYIPDRYVPDADERMFLYKRFARMTAPEEVPAMEAELVDRFGEVPPPARALLDLAAIKLEAQALGIVLAQLRDPAHRLGARAGATPPRGEANLEFAPGKALPPEAYARLSETFGRRILFKAGKTLAVNLIGQPPARLPDEVRNLLQVARFSSSINTLPSR
jgi:transcription-repair coupling factor (superfamily II helicase)